MRVEFAQRADARAIAVELDDPMAERVIKQRADHIAEHAASTEATVQTPA